MLVTVVTTHKCFMMFDIIILHCSYRIVEYNNISYIYMIDLSLTKKSDGCTLWKRFVSVIYIASYLFHISVDFSQCNNLCSYVIIANLINFMFAIKFIEDLRFVNSLHARSCMHACDICLDHVISKFSFHDITVCAARANNYMKVRQL